MPVGLTWGGLRIQHQPGLRGILRNLVFKGIQPVKAFFLTQQSMERNREFLPIQVALKVKQMASSLLSCPSFMVGRRPMLATHGAFCHLAGGL